MSLVDDVYCCSIDDGSPGRHEAIVQSCPGDGAIRDDGGVVEYPAKFVAGFAPPTTLAFLYACALDPVCPDGPRGHGRQSLGISLWWWVVDFPVNHREVQLWSALDLPFPRAIL